VQIDSTTIGQLNYTIIARDVFGNVGSSEKRITVVNRTDGGILLTVGLNVINRNGTHGVILTLNMSHWAVLYLTVSLTTTNSSQLLPGALPAGLVIALPVAFNFNLTNSSALRDCFVRVYYDQALIANQVSEADLAVLRWDGAKSAWVTSAAGMSRCRNYIDIGLSENGLHVIVSTPKKNHDPILVIVLIGIAGGIVSTAGYSYSRRKSMKISASGRTITLAPLAGALMAPRKIPCDGNGKHLNSLQGSAFAESQGTPATAMSQEMAMLKLIDALGMPIQARAVKVSVRCVLHKGPISGTVHACKLCGASYCKTCMATLVEIDEPCWACKQEMLPEAK